MRKLTPFLRSPLPRKKNHQTMIQRIDNLSAEKNYFEGKDEGKSNGIISILLKLSDKFISFEKTGPSINWELSKIPKFIVRDRQTKKMIIKEEPIYWRRILGPKTVIFLLRGLIPKFRDRYQRLRDKRISYNNLKKKPHTILSSPGFWTGCVCSGKLVGKDPNVKMRKFHR